MDTPASVGSAWVCMLDSGRREGGTLRGPAEEEPVECAALRRSAWYHTGRDPIGTTPAPLAGPEVGSGNPDARVVEGLPAMG